MSERLFAALKIIEPKTIGELIEAVFPSRCKLGADHWLVLGGSR